MSTVRKDRTCRANFKAYFRRVIARLGDLSPARLGLRRGERAAGRFDLGTSAGALGGTVDRGLALAAGRLLRADFRRVAVWRLAADRLRMSHTRTQVAISLIAGLMLSIGVFHMLPHALEELGDEEADRAAYGLIAGLVVMFLLLRIFSFHQHSHRDVSTGATRWGMAYPDSDPRPRALAIKIGPGAIDSHRHSPAAHSWAWWRFADRVFHTLIDGLASGRASKATRCKASPVSAGFGTSLAVFLHEPPRFGIHHVLDAAVGGWSSRSQIWANALSALICPLGAGLFVLGVHEFQDSS